MTGTGHYNMALKEALEDVVAQLSTLTWLHSTSTRERESGNAPYSIDILLDDDGVQNHYAVGNYIKSRSYNLKLMLNAVGRESDTVNLVDKCKAIDEALRADPRRAGQASSTILKGWSTVKQTSEGSQLKGKVEIVIPEVLQ
jgi:hypothetical protein